MPTLVRPAARTDLSGRLGALVGPERARELSDAAGLLGQHLAGGTLWHVNSTAIGGGVAEMLPVTIALCRELGVPAGWIVIDGDDDFFRITKRIGNGLYGSADGAGRLGPAERAAYRATLRANAVAIRRVVGRDAVVLHDHQTAGLVDLLADVTPHVYWRCHVGVDEPTDASERAWAFLAPMLRRARGFVFSVAGHVPAPLRDSDVRIVKPFISPFSAKNRDLDAELVEAALARCGLGRSPAPGGPHRAAALGPPAAVTSDAPPEPGEPLLVQVSRWDRLKDMPGVLHAFAEHVDGAYLALVGPDPGAIPDDTEQADCFAECLRSWRALPPRRRARAALVRLPMTDPTTNALLVNAVQRAATAVLQKSLAEGFGLTVAEAMWKSRPVLAGAVGGIREQITHGEDGLLVDDPTDLRGFGRLMNAVVHGGHDVSRLGARARRRVARDLLPDRDLVATARLVCGDGPDTPAPDIRAPEHPEHPEKGARP